MCIGTLARPPYSSEQDLSTEVRSRSEALQRRTPGERQSGDCAEGGQEPHEAILHRSILRVPVLPALEDLGRCHARSSFRPPCPKNTKTDLTRKSVGCTTRSTPTLSAHFRWGHQRVRAFLDARYGSTSARRTIGTGHRTGQYATIPMHTVPFGSPQGARPDGGCQISPYGGGSAPSSLRR